MELLARSHDSKAFDIKLALSEQVADQVHIREVTLAIFDSGKGQASDLHMRHEASICIYMISESTNLFWSHIRVVEQIS